MHNHGFALEGKIMKPAAGIALLLAGAALDALAIEEAAYEVVATDGAFELRDYGPQILAEVVVEADVEEAGNMAFRKLFRYISGGNEDERKIAMTSPVAQEPLDKAWAVSFMMPAAYSLDALPAPRSQDVRLREVPARRMAALRYSGAWGERGYREHLQALKDWLRERGLEAIGEPVWARYDPPFKPWFLRRNEILIPIDATAGG